jgi:predicted  nucleic acid-binding Zn-ribbon protein
MRSKFFLFILFLTFISACKDSPQKSDTPSQMKEVMAIHDEVMPKMGDISKLVATLKSKVDTTESGKEYEKAMIDLQNAHKEMMDWMRSFGDRFNSDEILNDAALSPEKLKWLDEEEQKIKKVKEDINSSIENAEKLLE